MQRSNKFNSVIIAGGRADKDGLIYGNTVDEAYLLVCLAVMEANFAITEVVSGGASGIDSLGERWANNNYTPDGNKIPIKKFPAKWDENGKIAGILRNKEMAKYAHALIAIWDGRSPGTMNIIKEATKEGLEIYVKHI